MIFTTLGNSEYIIHHPSEVELFAVTREQLELIALEAESKWKARWQNAFSIMVTCLINTIAIGWDINSASFRMNVGIGTVALIFGVVSLVKYQRDMKHHRRRVDDILNQPVQRTPITTEPIA